MKVAVFVVACVALAIAEPPVPSSQYLPVPASIDGLEDTSGQYAFAQDQTEAIITPNVEYGAPQVNVQRQTVKFTPTYEAPRTAIRNNYLPPASGYSGYANKGRQNYDDESQPANYNFQYDVQDSENEFSHEEARQQDQAQGKYSVVLPDGRRLTVEYTADADGFKPKISYEQTNNGGYSSGRFGGYVNGGYSNGAQNDGHYARQLQNGGYNGNGNGAEGYQY